jgi:hypothetical protein
MFIHANKPHFPLHPLTLHAQQMLKLFSAFCNEN